MAPGVPLTRYTEVDGLSIAYQSSGDGPAEVLWVPGMYSHIEAQWDIPGHKWTMEHLGSFARVTVFDKRGTGMSDRVSSPPTLEERMRDVGGVLDAARVDKAWLFGVSEGGPMSLLFAATFPERVHGVVLWGSYARFCRAYDYPWGPDRDEWMDWIREGAERWGDPDALAMDVIAPSRAGDRVFVEAMARALRLAYPPKVNVELWELAVGIDVRNLLEAVAVPVLVLHREDDQVIPVEHGRYLADNLPHGKLVELPGQDHLTQTMDEAALSAFEEFVTGSPSTSTAVTRTLATVLFTDIVGSTQSAVEMGDSRWVELLDRHDDVCGREIQRYGGHLIKSTGDGILATFDGPSRAVECASALRDALAAIGVQTRSGLHLGEIELRGDDIGGIAAHIAARAMSHAPNGHIAVTRTILDVVAGSGLDFTSLGAHELKGIPGSWELHQVI